MFYGAGMKRPSSQSPTLHEKVEFFFLLVSIGKAMRYSTGNHFLVHFFFLVTISLNVEESNLFVCRN